MPDDSKPPTLAEAGWTTVAFHRADTDGRLVTLIRTVRHEDAAEIEQLIRERGA